MRLFCDCKTDEEKSNFFLSGTAVETGVIAPAISNDVAMAYHRCAQFKKENDELRAKIEARERQAPAAFGLYSGWALKATYLKEHEACEQRDRRQLTADLSGSLEAYRVVPLYAFPGAKGE